VQLTNLRGFHQRLVQKVNQNMDRKKGKRFALIGAAGYVAPRHLKAIRATGNALVAALDRHDSVGILDSYFPDAAFFTEYERFDRHLYKLHRKGEGIDFLSICSPNHLHDAHIRFGMRNGADVICEKPLVLNPWNLEALRELENETGQRTYCILQLRHHPELIALKQRVEEAPADHIFDVELTYITSRGKWYYASWKGDEERSGGIATNIGIHFFDLLYWVFGRPRESVVHLRTHDRASGFLRMEKARVKWFLSIDGGTLPPEVRAEGRRTFRTMLVDKASIEFSAGFEDLHTKSYEAILENRGFGLDDALPAIQMTQAIRVETVAKTQGEVHSFTDLPLKPHPFKRSPQQVSFTADKG